MNNKKPGNGEFRSWRSYWEFRREVIRDWRYVRSKTAQAFLSAVATTCHDRSVDIPEGKHFFRAQVAHHDVFEPEVGDSFPGPALPNRMNPLRGRAREGRVNPKGIPCLYMASDKHTAMAEARPWIGSLVSLGVFRTERALKIVDCTRDADRNRFFLEGEPAVDERDQVVWSHMARAFREPATRDDDIAEYAPTQIIAEVFRSEGYDGVAYRSAFGTDRFNIALFDLDAAKLVTCALHEVRDVELKHEETANPYFVQVDEDGKPVLVRNVITDIRPLEPTERDESTDKDGV
ncbi:RES family NAD+ phosphorylase [Chelativorans alearense]|uniref:RES family NAD+ phosphorylase n=1 Tax=Chelativorans alearense TaxID=2681495 RepID=UPI0013D72D36|nr:RES family NAD+ phosphorylase [Chelativorans alearense]